jgi:hypothetical protein
LVGVRYPSPASVLIPRETLLEHKQWDIDVHLEKAD